MPYDGDMVSYREECLNERGTGRATGSEPGHGAGDSRGSRQEQRRESAVRRAALAPLKKAMTKKEQKVDAISAEIATLDEQLGDMALYENDPDKANLFSRQRGELVKSLEQAEADWLEASEAYEAAHV